MHPEILRRYSAQPGPAGLFGYSYGGLFALYALFRRSPVFHIIGASSPGVLSADSQIFALEQEFTGEFPLDERHLHLTLCELEMTGRTRLYRELGIQFANLIDVLHRSDHEGLRFSARILPDHTHSTGIPAAFLSFLRACYSVA